MVSGPKGRAAATDTGSCSGISRAHEVAYDSDGDLILSEAEIAHAKAVARQRERKGHTRRSEKYGTGTATAGRRNGERGR